MLPPDDLRKSGSTPGARPSSGKKKAEPPPSLTQAVARTQGGAAAPAGRARVQDVLPDVARSTPDPAVAQQLQSHYEGLAHEAAGSRPRPRGVLHGVLGQAFDNLPPQFRQQVRLEHRQQLEQLKTQLAPEVTPRSPWSSLSSRYKRAGQDPDGDPAVAPLGSDIDLSGRASEGALKSRAIAGQAQPRLATGTIGELLRSHGRLARRQEP